MPLRIYAGIVFVIVAAQVSIAGGSSIWSPDQLPILTIQPLISRPPLNSYVLVDGTVSLSCQAKIIPPLSSITWFVCGLDDQCSAVSKNAEILDDHDNAERYRIIRDEADQYNLQISAARLTDAGRYSCEVKYRNDMTEASAYLTVLESDPICTSSIPESGQMMRDQDYKIKCSVTYSGIIIPHMSWTGASFIRQHWITDSVSETEVESTLLFVADLSTDSNTLGCRTNFTEPEDVEGAQNAPDYDYKWESIPLHTMWGPKDLTVDPEQSIYKVGDNITCSANSRPAPIFIWQYIENSRVVYFPVINITPDMAGQQCTLHCTAFNIVNGFSNSESLILHVKVEDLGDNGTDN